MSASFNRLRRHPSVRYDSDVDFEQVLRTLLTEFERHEIRYAAIGGFAMGVLGAARATMDLATTG